MGQARLDKILIAVHRDEQEKFLSQIQEQGIIHITTTDEIEQTFQPSSEFNLTIEKISDAIGYLDRFIEKKGMLQAVIGTKDDIEYDEFKQVIKHYNLDKTVKKVAELEKSLNELETKDKTISAEIQLLSHWLALDYDFQEIYAAKRVAMILGVFPDKEDFIKAQAAINQSPIHIQVVNAQDDKIFCLIAFPLIQSSELKSLLLSHHLEIIDFSNRAGKPKEISEQLIQQKNEFKQQKEKIFEQSIKLIPELPKLKILYDFYHNQQQRNEVGKNLSGTTSVLFIEGWVKRFDFRRLEKTVLNFETAVIERVQPKPDEIPPVALRNRKLFRPFEVVLDMYGMPNHFEIDPTPLLAPWFAVFFALCLTDAGYGILLAVISFLLMKKLKAGKKLLSLFAICGIFTIFAGAATGGWFGDIVDKLGIEFLTQFRDSVLVFDPIKNPMPFFLLSLALGYLQVMFGIIIEIYDSIRQNNTIGAIFDQLPWFILINSVVAFFLSGKFIPLGYKPLFVFLIFLACASIVSFTRRNRSTMIHQIFSFIIIISALFFLGAQLNILPVIFSLAKFTALSCLLVLIIISIWQIVKSKKVIAPKNIAFFKTLLWGFYNLYGASSYVGLVLSYIRLMALGMVTAGIAIAINTIAWMVIKIPVFGIILAVIILIFGHLYNLAVNLLGAFVHTLRLHYVEFFPRFFTGGGERFSPFRWQNKYMNVK
jgi:V/A-type H+-transporting ATPase subunit I